MRVSVGGWVGGVGAGVGRDARARADSAGRVSVPAQRRWGAGGWLLPPREFSRQFSVYLNMYLFPDLYKHGAEPKREE